MHSDAEYKKFDDWIFTNSGMDWVDIDALKNDPDAAREKIKDMIIEFHQKERDELAASGVSPNLAQSIAVYADYLDDTPTHPISRRGPLADKWEETREWQTRLDRGEQWDEDIDRFGGAPGVTTELEEEMARELPTLTDDLVDEEMTEAYGVDWAEELTKGEVQREKTTLKKYRDRAGEVMKMPRTIEPGKTEETYIDETLPVITKTGRKIFVPDNIQKELIDDYGPDWRDEITVAELRARGAE